MKKIIFIIVILAITTPVFAQETVEEAFLRPSMEVEVIAALAAAETREQKLVALEMIEQMIAEGRVRQNDIHINAVLANLAGEGTTIVVREGSRRVNSFPDVRTRAARVLGELGGERARDTLIDITRNPSENESMVLSQVVFSLGLIGLNENNESLIAITNVLMNNSRQRVPDNNLAIASLLAIERIIEKNNGFPDEPSPRFLYVAITEVQFGNYSTEVRNWASALMGRLSRI
ncbi:MAG: HEAT repeat domain-containing protein [Spirochaetes bacterium]|nr:HEAT repeat domain-containing protein [Spirochaetota bacterium]